MNTAKIAGNYFAPRYYVQSETESALLKDREGGRLIALPEHFLMAMDETFRQETGKAAYLALYTCGVLWGEGFSKRFNHMLENLHGVNIEEVSLVDYLLAMRQVFAVHGFGVLGLDFSLSRAGIVIASLSQSMIAPNTVEDNHPSSWLEAGILAGWFSAWSGKRLAAIQTEGVRLGAARDRFLIVAHERLSETRKLVAAGLKHQEVIEALTAARPTQPVQRKTDRSAFAAAAGL